MARIEMIKNHILQKPLTWSSQTSTSWLKIVAGTYSFHENQLFLPCNTFSTSHLHEWDIHADDIIYTNACKMFFRSAAQSS